MALQNSILKILAKLFAFQSRIIYLCEEYKLVTKNISCIYFIHIYRDCLFVHH